ncbi:DUF1592 domain-containing protein [Solimonas variicoloris]|uniref:DUF1592 domain-containing protein n=1 Tax=Solimonas variicoloris TaxID=254408 RepID=UPI00037D11BC|nr:DUF1592 domain-containing protein [Solimonas variicoloris]
MLQRLLGGGPQSRKKKVLLGGGALAAVLLAAVVVGAMRGPAEPQSKGTPRSMRLLTQDQYLNTVAYVFGPNVQPTTRFAALPRIDGLLASGAAIAGLSDAQLETYQKTATKVAAQIVSEDSRPYLIPCEPAATDAADPQCAKEFLAQVAPLLYRRALSEEQIDRFVAAANQSADALHDFYQGLSVVVEGILMSPNVLLVAEVSEPDPDHPGETRLDSWSLATRLSLFLWNAAPDAELLAAAQSGALQTKKGLAAQVDRMLASPRLETGVRALFDDMFAFEDFNRLAKDNTIYPAFTGETAVDAREQTLRTVVDHLLVRRADYRDLFTTRKTFMSPSLAPIYKVAAQGPGWTPYEFPADDPHAGLLTHVSFEALHSHPGRSSPTLRGKALREVMLCQTVPRPPANVDFSKVQNPDGSVKTARERIDFHLQNPSCAGCHRIMDPMGLSMEAFDGAGTFRHEENGVPIDTSGNLDGVEFTDIVGLAKALRDNPQVPWCAVRRTFAYGTGTPADSNDRRVLEYLSAEFAGQGYVFPELLRDIALSRAFRKVYEPHLRKTFPLPDLKSAERPQQTASAEPASAIHP